MTKTQGKEEERCIDVKFGKDETYHMKIDVMDKYQLIKIRRKEVFIMTGANMKGTDFQLTVPKKPEGKQFKGFPCEVIFVYKAEVRRYREDETKCR